MGGLLRKPGSFPNLAESQLYHFGFALPKKTRHSSSAASSQQRGIHSCCFPLLIDLKLPGKLSPSSLPQREVDTRGTQHPLRYPKPAPCSLQFSPVLQGTRAYGPLGGRTRCSEKACFQDLQWQKAPVPAHRCLGTAKCCRELGKAKDQQIPSGLHLPPARG